MQSEKTEHVVKGATQRSKLIYVELDEADLARLSEAISRAPADVRDAVTEVLYGSHRATSIRYDGAPHSGFGAVSPAQAEGLGGRDGG